MALGDAYGAPFEGGLLERGLWSVLGKKQGLHRWTDDTQMALDVASILITHGRIDQTALARQFAQSYHWTRGYGPGTAAVLKRIRRNQPWEQACRAVYPDGSYGNGGAMRAPVVGLFYADSAADLVLAARQQACVTHAHPQAIEGAVLIARATALAAQGADTGAMLAQLVEQATLPEFSGKLARAGQWHAAHTLPPPKQVAAELGHGLAACESVVTAIFLAVTFMPAAFTELLSFATKLHGDTDTIAAMAGAIWGAGRKRCRKSCCNGWSSQSG